MPLHGTVLEGVVECRHDHRLVEHQDAMAHRSGCWVHRVVEAVRAVDPRVQRAQRLDVGVRLLGQRVEGDDRGVRRDRVSVRSRGIASEAPVGGHRSHRRRSNRTRRVSSGVLEHDSPQTG